MTIEQIQEMITNKGDVREIINQLADYIQANPGGAPGGDQLLQSATVTLTDAQIKALPTVPVEIVAAPGDNKMINLISAVIKINPSAGAYTVHADNVILLQYTGGEECSTYAILNSNTSVRIWTLLPQFAEDGRGAWTGYFDGRNNGESGVENLPLSIFAYNTGGDFGGGNAANTLKVTVYYVVVDL